MKRLSLLSIILHQDCLSNGSNGQTKQDLAVQHHQLCEQVQAQQFLVTSIPLYGCETWTLLSYYEKRIRAFETKCMRKLVRISYLKHKTNEWVRSKIHVLWVHRNLFWQLSSDGNLHGSGMSHATTTTASPKPSFRYPWRVGDAVVGGRNAE